MRGWIAWLQGHTYWTLKKSRYTENNKEQFDEEWHSHWGNGVIIAVGVKELSMKQVTKTVGSERPDVWSVSVKWEWSASTPFNICWEWLSTWALVPSVIMTIIDHNHWCNYRPVDTWQVMWSMSCWSPLHLRRFPGFHLNCQHGYPVQLTCSPGKPGQLNCQSGNPGQLNWQPMSVNQCQFGNQVSQPGKPGHLKGQPGKPGQLNCVSLANQVN